MPGSHGYSSGKFVLELDGKVVGFLQAAEGGEVFGEIVEEPAGPDGVVRKSISRALFAPIKIAFGTGMAKELYDWLSSVLAHKPTAKSGAIVFLDFNFKERRRIEFEDALITEIVFPALDVGSKDTAKMTVTLEAAKTRFSDAFSGGSFSGFGTKTQKKWSVSNFRFKITGLENACDRVIRIDAIKITQPVSNVGDVRIPVRTPGVLGIPSLVLEVAEKDSEDFRDWLSDFVIKGAASQTDERSGSIELLDQSLKDALFTVVLSQIGIVSVRSLRSENGAGVIARATVELYCEEMAFSANEVATGGAIAATPASASSATIKSAPNSRVALSDIVAAVLAGGAGALETFRDAVSAEAARPGSSLQAEIVATRLLTTVRTNREASPQVTKRSDGEALGRRWAEENATLEELEQLAALDMGDWSAVRLDGDHSLVKQLQATGLVPPGGDTSLELGRDAFVEGMVSGAASVLRSVSAHLPQK